MGNQRASCVAVEINVRRIAHRDLSSSQSNGTLEYPTVVNGIQASQQSVVCKLALRLVDCPPSVRRGNRAQPSRYCLAQGLRRRVWPCVAHSAFCVLENALDFSATWPPSSLTIATRSMLGMHFERCPNTVQPALRTCQQGPGEPHLPPVRSRECLGDLPRVARSRVTPQVHAQLPDSLTPLALRSPHDPNHTPRLLVVGI
jgi:hypothetical protein